MLMRVVSVDSWGQTKALKREWEEDFPGGPGVESPPATAEDMGSFPRCLPFKSVTSYRLFLWRSTLLARKV